MTTTRSRAAELAAYVSHTLAQEYEGNIPVGNIPPHDMEEIARLLSTLTRLEEENARLREENKRLRKWADLAELVMQPWPECGTLDGFDLQTFALKCGVLYEVSGGYDPEIHIDSVGVAPEKGDPWFEIIAFPALSASEEEG